MAVVEAVQIQSEEGYRVHFRSPSICRMGVIRLVPIRQKQKQVSGMNESQNRQTASFDHITSHCKTTNECFNKQSTLSTPIPFNSIETTIQPQSTSTTRINQYLIINNGNSIDNSTTNSNRMPRPHPSPRRTSIPHLPR